MSAFNTGAVANNLIKGGIMTSRVKERKDRYVERSRGDKMRIKTIMVGVLKFDEWR